MKKTYIIIIIIAGVVISSVILNILNILNTEFSNNSKATASNVVRIGFFANITHAPALVAKANGIFEQEFKGYKVEYKIFKAGPDAALALLTGNVDFVYIGPIPAINAYSISNGKVRVIAGVAANGTMFIVNESIDNVNDLKSKVFGTPQYANTQDIALKYYLMDEGIDADVINAKNSELLILFKNGHIQGAWVPEPWATRMLNEGGKVFIDEKDLWEGKRFATSVLITSTDTINNRADLVYRMLNAHINAIDWMRDNKDKVAALLVDEIKNLTGQSLPEGLINRVLSNVEFTYDPMVSSIQGYYERGKRLGLITQDIDIMGMVYTEPLDDILANKQRSKLF